MQRMGFTPILRIWCNVLIDTMLSSWRKRTRRRKRWRSCEWTFTIVFVVLTSKRYLILVTYKKLWKIISRNLYIWNFVLQCNLELYNLYWWWCLWMITNFLLWQKIFCAMCNEIEICLILHSAVKLRQNIAICGQWICKTKFLVSIKSGLKYVKYVKAYVPLRLRVQNAVSAQPCVGKFRISLVLLNFLHCNFKLWFETP